MLSIAGIMLRIYSDPTPKISRGLRALNKLREQPASFSLASKESELGQDWQCQDHDPEWKLTSAKPSVSLRTLTAKPRTQQMESGQGVGKRGTLREIIKGSQKPNVKFVIKALKDSSCIPFQLSTPIFASFPLSYCLIRPFLFPLGEGSQLS